METIIVKVQAPLAGHQQVLVSNEDKSICQVFPWSKEIKDRMRGKAKKFMYAQIAKDGALDLYQDAPSQDW